jgi:hypothetical protein
MVIIATGNGQAVTTVGASEIAIESAKWRTDLGRLHILDSEAWEIPPRRGPKEARAGAKEAGA